MTLGSTLPDQMLRHWSAVAIIIIISIQNGGGRWTSNKSEKNILIGVTGSVASIKLPKLVDELHRLQPKVPYICVISEIFRDVHSSGPRNMSLTRL